ncbi:MAG TPA: hypothetical protein PL033_16225 [Candidatus Brocadiia bacterium]|nr:hypothetical protein [Candidatus Brocadiia bacterium]
MARNRDATIAVKCRKCGTRFVGVKTYDGMRCPQCGGQGKKVSKLSSSFDPMSKESGARRYILGILFLLIALGILGFAFYYRYLRKAEAPPSGRLHAAPAQCGGSEGLLA